MEGLLFLCKDARFCYSTARGDDMHAKDGSEASVGSCRLAAKTGACAQGAEGRSPE